MELLYLGKYKRRFEPVISHIKKLAPGARVLELCFGDIYLADFCRKNGFSWIGLDINADFVKVAARLGFNAHVSDLTAREQLPSAHLCVMMGSMYHFHSKPREMLAKMLAAAGTIILSEPVVNLSSSPGLIGWLAKKGANAGKGHEVFRYDKRSLLKMLEENSMKLKFNIEEIEDFGKDLIVKLAKNEVD